jgi:hypothetical protein
MENRLPDGRRIDGQSGEARRRLAHRLSKDRLQAGCCFLLRYAGLEPAHYMEPIAEGRLQRVGGASSRRKARIHGRNRRKGVRDVDLLTRLHTIEFRLRHTHDGERGIVKQDMLADDARVERKPCPPIVVTDHGNRILDRYRFVDRQNRTALDRSDPKYREVIARDQLALRELAASVDGDIDVVQFAKR